MFTGIITHAGVIDAIERSATGARLTLRTDDREPYLRGESVAVNGVCLTVLPQSDGSIAADVSDETLRLTTFPHLVSGGRVNIERALAVGARLGGHIVQGHVDTTGTLVSRQDEGEFCVQRWSFPPEFADLVVAKGSIAVDGVSLTIVEPDATTFGAALIPETLQRTTLGEARPGTPVNLEFDVIAKHIRRLVEPYLRREGLR